MDHWHQNNDAFYNNVKDHFSMHAWWIWHNALQNGSWLNHSSCNCNLTDANSNGILSWMNIVITNTFNLFHNAHLTLKWHRHRLKNFEQLLVLCLSKRLESSSGSNSNELYLSQFHVLLLPHLSLLYSISLKTLWTGIRMRRYFFASRDSITV